MNLLLIARIIKKLLTITIKKKTRYCIISNVINKYFIATSNLL